MEAFGDRLVWPGGELWQLTDGAVRFGRDLFPDPRGAVVPEALVLPIHAFLLKRPGAAPVLIDSGAGMGGVAEGLARAGVAVEEIGTVIFTHLHSDHCGGYLAGGFGKAGVCLSAAEAAFWAGKDHAGARTLAAAEGRLHTVADGDEIVPGVTVWALPGHTPGHIGLVIDGQVAVVGDILHRADLQLADPLLSTKFDSDPAQAVASRTAALARVAAEGMVICGGHIRLPGQEEAAGGAGFLRLTPKGGGHEARAA